jgi:hypothetical protein
MKKIENSKIIDLFYGEIIRKFECIKGHSKHKFEKYQCLSLSFPPPKTSGFSNFHSVSVDLMDMIKKEL